MKVEMKMEMKVEMKVDIQYAHLLDALIGRAEV